MPDYIFEAVVKLRVKDVKDFLEASERVEEFFSLGLEHLAYSDDENDNPYEIENVKIHWDRVRED